MLAPVHASDKFLELVENSGVQFYDKEVSINFYDRNDPVSKIATNYFLPDDNGENGHLMPLFFSETEPGKLVNPADESKEDPELLDTGDTRLIPVKLEDSLCIYNGVWFPVPFFATHVLTEKRVLSHNGAEIGPLNWARARVVRIFPQEGAENAGMTAKYRIVYAFDTATQKLTSQEYFSPRDEDVRSGVEFALDYRDGGHFMLSGGESGKSWVAEWAEKVFRGLGGKNKRGLPIPASEMDKAVRIDHLHEAHYLNLLTFLGTLCDLGTKEEPGLVKLRSRGTENDPAMDVSLVLDIGNSRSCGLLIEDGGKAEPGTAKLALRDLNAPENIYEDAFESRIEFAKANFDFDGTSARSGWSDAFCWPSLVRVGHEAARLSSMRSGNEGLTGLSSPKRYLWKDYSDKKLGEWRFNPYSYQTPVLSRLTKEPEGTWFNSTSCKAQTPAYLRPVSDYINSSGDAIFACEDRRNMTASYSGKSCMTFMLLEIFLQAAVQINSYAYRYKSSFKDRPRRLKAIVLTTPPSMPDLEREIFRGCAYEAVGILWKCLGYDSGRDNDGSEVPPYDFRFTDRASQMNPKVPEIVLDWDEAEAGQIVYLYNETQKIMGGNNLKFIEFIRRPDAQGRYGEAEKDEDGHELISARIASIDIGGGTTDMVITDYAFPKAFREQQAAVRVREVLREGYKVAGDDIVLRLIQSCILYPLSTLVAQKTQNRTAGGEAARLLAEVFGQGGSSSDGGDVFRTMRQQAVQQILIKVALRIMGHLERLEHLPDDELEASVSGTVGDFLTGKEKCSAEQLKIPDYEETAFYLPEPAILDFVNSHFAKYLGEFDILKFQFSVDLMAVNRVFARGGSRISDALAALTAICSLYKADLLLLTGRPSRIRGVREYMLERLNLAPARIITLADYATTGSWYPYAGNGTKIGDTKYTVAVGAAIAYARRSTLTLRDFRFDLGMPEAASAVRYFGHIDSFDHVNHPFYRCVTASELNRANGVTVSDSEDEAKMEMLTNDARTGNREEDEIRRTDTHILPDNLGYRQFKSSNDPEAPDDFLSTKLYSLEPVKTDEVEDVQAVKDAANLGLFFEGEDIEALVKPGAGRRGTLSGVFKKNAEEAYAEYAALRDQVESEALPELKTLRPSLIAKLDADAKAYGEKQAGPKPKLFGRGEWEAKAKQEAESYRSANVAGIEKAVADKKSELLDPARAKFWAAVREQLVANYNSVRAQSEEALNDLADAISNKNAPFEIELEVNDPKLLPPEMARLNGIREQIAKDRKLHLSKVFSLKLNKVEYNGRPYRAYVRLRLKTVTASDEEYWSDTGIVYTGEGSVTAVGGK